MIINTNSWHYKLYSFTYLELSPPPQTNLCQYIRRLFLVPLVALIAGFAIVFMKIWDIIEKLLLLIMAGYYKIKPIKSNPSNKKPSIIATYLRAKKDKVCPLVEFKYDENH